MSIEQFISRDRYIERARIKMSGAEVTVRRVFCKATLPSGLICNQSGEIVDRSRHGLPFQMATKKFSQKGWHVGDHEKDDKCPACLAREMAERRAKHATNKPTLHIVTDIKPRPDLIAPPKSVDDAPLITTPITDERGRITGFVAHNLPSIVESPMPAEAPTQMSLQDRRIILAKLQDVYLDEARGYDTPWTDDAVAKDLGVPKAWVVKLREENFGPARDNSEIREWLKKGEDAIKIGRELAVETRNNLAKTREINDRHNELNGKLAEMNRTLDLLVKQGERIAKAVGA